jgi:hypothetical protein
MSRQRSKYQIEFQEAIDDTDDWRNYAGEVWSETAARNRVQELMSLRPSRRYRIVRRDIRITTFVIWQSEEKEKKA